MATQIPIPQNPIGENFVWREWFQKLSNRVYGSLSTQESSNVSITGGAIDNTVIGNTTRASGKFTSLQLTTPLALAYGGTNANTAANARTNLGVTATGSDTTYSYRANNLSDLVSASTARTNLGLGTMATQNVGISTTVALAKLTLAGSNGSFTVSNGIITAYTAPT
jgi:hypothetical protein